MYQVWPNEIAKWTDFSHLTYSILHGSTKEVTLKEDTQIHIINPEGLAWLLKEGRKLPEYDVLVIDESSKFKDSSTQRFKLLKKYLPVFNRRWILTGSFSPNSIMDTFSQVYILDGGRSLGRYITHFRTTYFERSAYNMYDWKIRTGAFEEVTEKIAPLMLQLNAEDHLKMPERQYLNVFVKLPKEAQDRYRAVEEDFFSSMDDGKIVAGNAAVASGKCRQIANGAVYDADRNVIHIHDEKLDALESLLDELNGKPTLLLYEFQHDLDRILARIGKNPCLGSGLSPKQLESYITGFNAGEIPLLLGHPASMGHGLNLQGSCHHIIWFGIPWSLELYEQTIARVYRQGQQASTVFIYHIVAQGTIDERVLTVLTAKDKNQRKLLNAIAAYRTEHLNARED